MRKKYRKKKMKRERIPVILRKLNLDEPFLKSTVDFKNLRLLRQFLNSRGKILPRRLTRLKAKEQRYVANAIKTARVIGFLRF